MSEFLIHFRKHLGVCSFYFLALVLVPATVCKTVERYEVFAEGNYTVSWVADLVNKVIQFDIQVKTLGYLSFGVSPTGGTTFGDLIIAGVYDDGTPYFTDRYRTGFFEPDIDPHQDWSLLSWHENATHTSLLVSRPFNTCDDKDVPISEDTLKLIWSYGSSDEVEYHRQERGSKLINFLDPPMPSPNVSKFQKWAVLTNDTIPSEKTSRWCTIHEGPNISKIHYAIGFDKLLENSLAVKHTYRLAIRKCALPEGSELDPTETFGQHVGKPGQDCQARPLLNTFCSTSMFVWAVGGGKTMFPDHVGFSIGTDPHEYYMLEIHYNNPEAERGLQFETGLEIYYTEDFRKNEAGIMRLGHVVSWTQTIPPNAQDFTVYGHCGSGCTEAAFPEDGINVFNVLLHTHKSGRKLKMHHFTQKANDTGLVELPWFISDDMYDFNYQQNRPLREEKKVNPGDHLAFTCTYDTSWLNGSVVIGDLGIEGEACEAFFYYYPRLEIDNCMSSYNPMWIMSDFGIQAFTSGGPGEMDPVIALPKNFAGIRYTEYLRHNFTWSKEFVAKYQQRLEETSHIQVCESVHNISFVPRVTTTEFPTGAEVYEPLEFCESVPPGSSGANSLNCHHKLKPLILIFIIFIAYQ